MPRRNWKMRIQDILKAANKIVTHTRDLDLDTFSADEWMIDAVLRNFTVIGEVFKDWCDQRNIKPRYSAVGEHGSIAVVGF